MIPGSTPLSSAPISATADGGGVGPPALTLVGPTSGRYHTASTNFTIALQNGLVAVTATIADSVSDGELSGTSFVLDPAGVSSRTFTVTPGTSGNRTISVTNNGGLSNPSSIVYNATVASVTLTPTDLTASRIYQRAAGSTAKTIALAGTATGDTTEIETIESEIVLASDSSVVQTWTALSSASVGASYSGNLSVPQGGWYHRLDRAKDAYGTVIGTSSETANAWSVGILIALLGQSNMAHMTSVSSTPPATDTKTKQYTTGGGWAAVAGNGAIQFANLMRTGVTIPVGVLPYAIDGTALHINGSRDYWTDLTAGEPYPLFIVGLTAVGSDCEFVLWHQGESDAILATTKTQYKADLDTLYGRIRSATGRSTATLQFGCAIMGTLDAILIPIADADCSAIRDAQLEWISATTGAVFAGSSVDMPLVDDAHWAPASYERMGRRYAQAVLYQLALASYGSSGPKVAGVTRALGSADVYLNISQGSGTGLTESDGSTTGIGLTGFEVSSDNFSTLLTISSTAFSSGRVKLTLSSAPADVDTVKVRYQYGEQPPITNPAYDNTTPGGDTLGLPLQPTDGSFTAGLPFDAFFAGMIVNTGTMMLR